MQKKCRRKEKLLATSSGEGIVPAPATSAFIQAERNTLSFQAFAIGAVPEKTVEITDKVIPSSSPGTSRQVGKVDLLLSCPPSINSFDTAAKTKRSSPSRRLLQSALSAVEFACK
jgi:hypothetical protein